MKSNNKNIYRILLPLFFLIMLLPSTYVEGAMNDYCAIPPFLSQSIPPNVLIVLDNSGSMCGQAYAGSYDPSGFANGLYYGYFDGAKNYKYTGNNRWEVTTDPMNTGNLTNPIATGSFLNWATMRRVEVAKKLLIGGKASPRSPVGAVTVKLNGETGCDRNFLKDYNTSAGNLIYPFVGNYRFSRDNSDDLTISPLVAGTDTENRYPTSDVANGAWVPNSGTTRWTQVDEVSSDGDTTYIQNTTSNTNDQVIMGYDKSAFSIAGTITNVTVVVRAKRIGTGTRRIQGVLRVKDTASVDADFIADYQNLTTSYANYQFSWATNPQTNLAWTWSDLTTSGMNSLTGFGVKAYTPPTSTQYPRVTQSYIIVTVSNPAGGPFNTIVDQGMVKAEGIIDTLTSDVRFGLSYYNTDNSGRIDTYVGFGMATDMITSIQNMVPSTWTPLAETLYEMMRYFRQDDPYYSNSPADYSKAANGANIIRDPYWYKFTDLDNTLTDMYVPCAKSFVLFLTDGESTQDLDIPGTGSGPCSLTNIQGCSVDGSLPDTRYAGTVVGTTYPSNGTDYMIDVAYWARTNDMRNSGACTTVPTTETFQQCLPGTQNVITYPVFMFGSGSTLLKDVSIYGGFNDLNGNNMPDCITIPAECYSDTDGDGTIESNGDDNPLTYYEGDDGYSLEKSIKDAINDILKRSSSGTAASVLASGEGSGANLIQALFYPKRTFDTTDISWLGYLKNLWYYIDPFFAGSSIMDDSTSDKILNLSNDCTIAFTTSGGNVQVIKGGACASETIDVDDMSVLWEAGKLLFERTPGDTNPGLVTNRTIYTTTDGLTRIPFETPANATLQTLLQAPGNQNLANRIISYTRGTDYNSKFCSSTVATSCTLDADCPGGETCINYRNRTAGIDLNNDNDTSDPGETNVWKLGDIISSTPKIVSWTALNGYYKVFSDQSYKEFTETPGYQNRGMVFVGANDGMLHAFKLGDLGLPNSSHTAGCTFGANEKACLSGSDLGKEMWAFIPMNTLPYLKYMADPSYCHIYSIDATPYIFDASINGDPNDAKDVNSWKTVLIGGMRLGGACKAAPSTYGVQTPLAGVGYSSYFALDITDPTNPTVLWEFSHPDLGFSTTGPAVVRISAKTGVVPDNTKNGYWFVVFGSGPTGPIDTTAHQFKGFSDQQLKLFAFDVKLGPGAGNANVTTITPGTAINYAFAGSLRGSPIDIHENNPAATGYYQDDAIYFGYTQSEDSPPTASTKWTNGGVLRLFTNEDYTPSNWTLNPVISNIGPVTAEVAKLQNYKYGSEALWLYFGTGRYYYKTSADVDDANNQRKFYGIKEPCFSASGFNTSCTTTVAEGSLGSAATSAGSSDPDGWYITLDAATTTYKAERVIASPTSASIGVVFFPTAKPSTDICQYGGATHLWAVDYDTGGRVSSELLTGRALMQVSSGSIEQVDISEAFLPEVGEPEGGEHKGGRRTSIIDGIAVAAPPIIVPPKAVKRQIHMRER